MPAAAPLRARDLTVVRGPTTVLDGIELVVGAGQRIGIVGPNGVGKSTLLQALAGQLPIDRGRVDRTPPTATVGYLPQEPNRSTEETVRALLARRTGVTAATAELEMATAALAAAETGADDRYAFALDRWLALGGPDLETRVAEVLDGLGVPVERLDQATSTLSGGEAARAGLAALQLARFDVFLLDEPTNDLDIDGLDRLERWITALPAAVVLVSHDRTFLARTVTDVIELDEFSHAATRYGGGWQAYLDERETARRAAWERFEAYDTQRRGLVQRAQREREWATQGLSKVRKSDEPDKNIKAFKVNQTEQLAGRAARTQRMAERLEVVDKPRQPWQLRLAVASPGRSGDIVARFEGVEVARGDFRLGPVDLTIGAGEQIALVGANGSGKTTLLDVLAGRAQPSAGEVRRGPSVVVGEVAQARDRLRGGQELLRAFQDDTGLDASEARTLLAKFGLVADHVTRPAATLSPGERTRASLALLMANGANVLVLDEPTNHLDLPAIEQLEAALDGFDGTVLLVTHDRSLLEHVRLTRRIELDAGRVVSDRAL
ncbi:MAG: ABC-F family ATP-binding cassette domain-containing protein [Ilumatobacteraceae bacterium]